jgi:hypothetical protein
MIISVMTGRPGRSRAQPDCFPPATAVPQATDHLTAEPARRAAAARADRANPAWYSTSLPFPLVRRGGSGQSGEACHVSRYIRVPAVVLKPGGQQRRTACQSDERNYGKPINKVGHGHPPRGHRPGPGADTLPGPGPKASTTATTAGCRWRYEKVEMGWLPSNIQWARNSPSELTAVNLSGCLASSDRWPERAGARAAS